MLVSNIRKSEGRLLIVRKLNIIAMDAQEKSRFKKLYEELPEQELIEMLLADKSAYQPGCHELLNDEMIRRGIEDKIQSRRKKEEKYKRRKINFTKPSGFSIISVLLVLFWPLYAFLSMGMAVGVTKSTGNWGSMGDVLFILLGLAASKVIPIIGSVLAFIGLMKNSKDYVAYLGLILNLAIVIRIFGLLP